METTEKQEKTIKKERDAFRKELFSLIDAYIEDKEIWAMVKTFEPDSEVIRECIWLALEAAKVPFDKSHYNVILSAVEKQMNEDGYELILKID